MFSKCSNKFPWGGYRETEACMMFVHHVKCNNRSFSTRKRFCINQRAMLSQNKTKHSIYDEMDVDAGKIAIEMHFVRIQIHYMCYHCLHKWKNTKTRFVFLRQFVKFGTLFSHRRFHLNDRHEKWNFHWFILSGLHGDFTPKRINRQQSFMHV